MLIISILLDLFTQCRSHCHVQFNIINKKNILIILFIIWRCQFFFKKSKQVIHPKLIYVNKKIFFKKSNPKLLLLWIRMEIRWVFPLYLPSWGWRTIKIKFSQVEQWNDVHVPHLHSCIYIERKWPYIQFVGLGYVGIEVRWVILSSKNILH